eukprot:9224397-Pyramimonas_sp.AAC.1
MPVTARRLSDSISATGLTKKTCFPSTMPSIWPNRAQVRTNQMKGEGIYPPRRPIRRGDRASPHIEGIRARPSGPIADQSDEG